MKRNKSNEFQTLLRKHLAFKGTEIYLIDLEENRGYTYNDLFSQSLSIRNILTKSVNKGQHVGIMLSKSSLYLPTLLACWQIGAIPAVLDDQVTSDRFYNLKELVNFQYLVVDKVYKNYEKQSQIILEETKHNKKPILKINLEIDELVDPSILLFSTGTTGLPKCVPLSLNNILKNVESLNARLNLAKNPVFLCCSPLSYAHGLYNSFLTSLILGGKVISGGSLTTFNAEKILTSAKFNNVSVFHITPSMLPILTFIGNKIKEELPSFGHVICGTARLRLEEKLKFENLYGTLITQQYGMTEALFMAINNDCQNNKAGSVGTPLDCIIRVLNDDGHIKDDHESGHIIVKSSSCFGSYYNQSDETNLAYRDGWFYTGDLGFIDQDGHLTIVGRSKEIIKKGGFNINPREIDAIIAKYQGVNEVSTVGVFDLVYGEEIYSFVMADKSLDYQALDLYCKKSIQSSHRPKKIFFVEDFPRSKSGKILTKALKEMVGQLCK